MKVLLVWVAVCLMWSTVWLFIKMGVRDVPPLGFAAVRLVVAVVVLLPVLFVRRTTLPRGRRDWALVAATGLFLFSLNYGLLYWGTQFISSGLAAVLHAATPAFGLVLAHYMLPGERVTAAKAWALGLGVVGVAIIFFNQLQLAGRPALVGSAAVTTSALFVALSYVLVKAHGSHLRPTALMTGQMFFGMVPLLAFSFAREGNPLAFRWTPTAVASMLYLALAGSVAAFWLNYWLLRRMDATKVLMMNIVEPLLAVLLGALVLGEEMTARTLLGGACVLLSVWLVLRRRDAQSPPAVEQAETVP